MALALVQLLALRAHLDHLKVALKQLNINEALKKLHQVGVDLGLGAYALSFRVQDVPDQV